MHQPNINVVLMDNPYGIKGSTNKNKDGSFTIIINSHLSFEEQRKTYKHELFHIMNEDFDKECFVDQLENSAHSFQE